VPELLVAWLYDTPVAVLRSAPLPEGPALARMATLAGVRPVDTFGILKVFGRDCAGAIVVLAEGERPSEGAASHYTPMALDELRQVITQLDVAPLGAAPERGFRPSLAGFQRKACLCWRSSGTTGRSRPPDAYQSGFIKKTAVRRPRNLLG
jgi:hypothetical protein